jgi:hypothetical protein
VGHALRVLALLTGCLVAQVPSDAELLGRAEGAFREGVRLRDSQGAREQFLQTAQAYEALRERGYRSPALLRNQGNAYLLAGDVPRAILAYRRGLRLAPQDRELRGDLETARARVLYPSPERLGAPDADAWPAGLPRVSPWLCFNLGAAAYALAWVGLTRWAMVRRGRLLVASLTCLGVAVPCAAGVALAHWQGVQDSRQPLVVIAADGVVLRAGNGLSYPPRVEVSINRGVEARRLFVRGGWLQIQLAGGEVGWIPRSAALLDES